MQRVMTSPLSQTAIENESVGSSSQPLPKLFHTILLLTLAFIYSGAFLFLSVAPSILLYSVYFILIATILATLIFDRMALYRLKSVLPYFLWFAFYLVSGTIASPYIGIVLPEDFRMLFKTLLIVGGISVVIRSKQDISRLSYFFQVASVINLVICIYEFYNPDFIYQIGFFLNAGAARVVTGDRPGGLWVNPNYAAAAFVFSLLLTKWHSNNFLCWISRIASVVGVYLTASRTGSYMLAICLVLYLVFQPKNLNLNSNRKLKLSIIASTFITAFILLLLLGFFSKILIVDLGGLDNFNVNRILDFSSQREQEFGVYTRLDLANFAIERASNGPWYGYGIFSFQGLDFGESNSLLNQTGHGAHNIYVTAWGEVGMIGLLLFLLTLLYGLVTIFKVKLSKEDRLVLIMLWIVYLLWGLVSHNIFADVVEMIYTGLVFHLPSVMKEGKSYKI